MLCLIPLFNKIFNYLCWGLNHRQLYWKLSFQDAKVISDVTETWSTIPDVDASASSKTVFGLKPNSTYYFRVFAVNELGPGPNVSVEAETKFNAEEIDQANQLLQETEGASMYMKWVINLC